MNIFKKANSEFLVGNFDKALELYKLALVQYPELQEVIMNNINRANLLLKENNIVVKDTIDTTISKDVFVGIAAIPAREEALKKTIESLLPQVTKLGVYLNGWTHIPDYLKHHKIIVEGFHGKDLGDVGKFYWLDNHNGIYFSCDDDLVYPKDYIKRTISKLEQYNYQACIGWHGSVLYDNFKSFYDKDSRRVFTFSAHRPYDTPVHILGTGCSAFHTQTLDISLKDFLAPNMADVFFAIKGQEQKVPFYVIEHEAGEITATEGTVESSIFQDSSSGLDSRKNTLILQNNFVKSLDYWVLNSYNKPLRLLVIGRFESYSKGGIYKSCHLIKTSLESLGHTVDVLDTQNDLKLGNTKYDACWIYPGDPNRPDFNTVDLKIQELQNHKIPVLVNLSYLYDDDRTKWIVEKIKSYNKIPSPVLAVLFSESSAKDRLFDSIKNYICVIPKTLLPTPYEKVLPFDLREGICLGDATKLTNDYVTHGRSHAWIEAIHRRMPQVNLYAYKQYSGKNTLHPKVKLVPHMGDNFGEWLGSRRLFICLNVHLTFEMVACEAQIYGTPILYRHMPQSLSEYISATGIAVSDPYELGEMTTWLYNNQQAWSNLSQSSIYRAKSNHIDVLRSSLEGYIRLAIIRADKIRSNYK